MKKNGNRKQLPFTLIELVIVIAILGALVALILPAFSTTEKDAKETSDAYNSRGVVRYVQMFQNANGYYPSGFHTGLTADGTPMGLSEAFGVEEAEHHHDDDDDDGDDDHHHEEGYTLEEDAPVEITTLSDTDNAKYISSLKGLQGRPGCYLFSIDSTIRPYSLKPRSRRIHMVPMRQDREQKYRT